MRQILCPVVVGRHEELGLLRAALDEARAGRGRLVLIQGEAGVGKSRLTLQLEAAARSVGMQVLRGRAGASSSSVPFRPFAEALLGARARPGLPTRLSWRRTDPCSVSSSRSGPRKARW